MGPLISCGGSGPLKRASDPPLFLCGRAVFCLSYETAMGWLATPRQTKSLKSLLTFVEVQSQSGKSSKVFFFPSFEVQKSLGRAAQTP